MRSIIFVCTANLCRSPCAEAVLRSLLPSGSFEIDSAGTRASTHGGPPYRLAAQAAGKRGYDVSACNARRVKSEDFERFDMILVMDKTNLADLQRIVPTRYKQKIELLLEYGNKYSGREVPDPIGQGEPAFEIMMDMIEDGCRGLAQVLAQAA